MKVGLQDQLSSNLISGFLTSSGDALSGGLALSDQRIGGI
jgi:hypothetical protein